MYLTITYDNLKITCKCEKYGNFFEVEEMDCPDHDSAVSEFVCDRYEKDQQFAMIVQDSLHREYHMVLGEDAAMREEMQQEDRLLAVWGGR
jgi:hypothetical protein